MRLRRLQQEHRKWAAHNFPGYSSEEAFLGMVEELGELAHAHLKSRQGIRGDKAHHRAKAKDAVADLMIFIASYCNRMEIDLETVVTMVWAEVKSRDWVKYPLTGRPAPRSRRKTKKS